MNAMEQAIAALRAAMGFASYAAEAFSDEDALALHRQCMEAVAALCHEARQRNRRRANQEPQEELSCITTFVI
jgi:hypothetical protein